MNFKVGDKVISVKKGQDTDQIGIVLEVTEDNIKVTPVEFFGAIFDYDINGNHREDTRFSIRKKEVQ
jgi:ribosomal protein L14E/L6E/L27E